MSKGGTLRIRGRNTENEEWIHGEWSNGARLYISDIPRILGSPRSDLKSGAIPPLICRGAVTTHRVSAAPTAERAERKNEKMIIMESEGSAGSLMMHFYAIWRIAQPRVY